MDEEEKKGGGRNEARRRGGRKKRETKAREKYWGTKVEDEDFFASRHLHLQLTKFE